MEGMDKQRSALESDWFLSNSKITVLINNIVKMAKSPTIESDLSQVLDEFLLKLGNCDNFLEHGIFNMNFAEAALLLQASADLYSKKVDLLWDVIFDYQKRMLLSEELNGNKDQELEKVEERKRKYKRKRKTNADEKQTQKMVNNFSFGDIANCNYLNQTNEVTDLSKEWNKFNAKTQVAEDWEVSNKRFSFLPDDSVHTEDLDYLGKYHQFHSTSLLANIFHLEEQNLLSDDLNCILKMRIDSYVVNDFLIAKSISSDQCKESYSAELNEYVSSFWEKRRNPDKNNMPCQVSDPVRCKNSFVCLERIPFSVLRDKLRRASVADSVLDDDHMSFTYMHCPSPCNSLDEKTCESESFDHISGNVEGRSKSCSQDSAFYEDDDQHNEDMTTEDILTDIAPGSDVPAPLDTDKSTSEDVTEAVDSEIDEAGDIPNLHDINNVIKDSPSLEMNHEPTISETVITRQRGVKRLNSIIEKLKMECEDEPKKRTPPKRRRISENVLKKLATGITAKYQEFEIFLRMHYKTAEGEGIVPEDVSDSEDSDEESDDQESENDEDSNYGLASRTHSDDDMLDAEEHDEPNESSTNAETNERVNTPDLPGVLDSVPSVVDLDTPSCSTSKNTGTLGLTSTPHGPVVPFLSFDASLENEKGYRRNVKEWRAFIIPKLKKMENKADFDIHEYESKIIEPSQIGEERYFDDIVKGKNASEVSRYFIATLQLANTYNVEISKTATREPANGSFKIKTLDKVRHHELLEEYQAPSEESFVARLKKAKSAKSYLHSTPINFVRNSQVTSLSRKKLF